MEEKRNRVWVLVEGRRFRERGSSGAELKVDQGWGSSRGGRRFRVSSGEGGRSG